MTAGTLRFRGKVLIRIGNPYVPISAANLDPAERDPALPLVQLERGPH
jgi:hypothetical protein